MGIVIVHFTKVDSHNIETPITLRIDERLAHSWLILEGVPYKEIFTNEICVRKDIRIEK